MKKKSYGQEYKKMKFVGIFVALIFIFAAIAGLPIIRDIVKIETLFDHVTIYNFYKSFHLISLISWMAGLFYLPRLFVYHAQSEKGTIQYKTFVTMEHKLLKFIMNPAMIFTFITGINLITLSPDYYLKAGWFHMKVLLVLLMACLQGMMSKWHTLFKNGKNTKTHISFRIVNEIPTVILIVVVVLVIFKPF